MEENIMTGYGVIYNNEEESAQKHEAKWKSTTIITVHLFTHAVILLRSILLLAFASTQAVSFLFLSVLLFVFLLAFLFPARRVFFLSIVIEAKSGRRTRFSHTFLFGALLAVSAVLPEDLPE